MPTNIHKTELDSPGVVTARRTLALQILSAVAGGLPGFPYVAAYLIGSASRADAFSPKDVDILLIDLGAQEPTHSAELHGLLASMQDGNPFQAAFDAAGPELSSILIRLVASRAGAFPTIRVATSFAFGPTQGETQIPTDGLHIHVSGPLTRGDLKTVESLFPFHAADFLMHHKVLVGPPLSTLISPVSPTLEDLLLWDRILLRRFTRDITPAGQRKWLGRILNNRTVVQTCAHQQSELIASYRASLKGASSAEMREMARYLVTTLAALPRPFSPHSQE